MSSLLKYQKHLDILGIDSKEWETLTLPKVIMAYNNVRQNLGGDETFEHLNNTAYQEVRKAVLNGENKPKKKGEHKPKKLKRIKEDVSEDFIEEFGETVFEDMLPYAKIIKRPMGAEGNAKLPIPEEAMGEGLIIELDRLTKFKMNLKDIIIPEQKNAGEILLYSDMIRLLKLQVTPMKI